MTLRPLSPPTTAHPTAHYWHKRYEAERKARRKCEAALRAATERTGAEATSPWREIASAPRHGNYARVSTEEGLLYCPDNGEATHWMPLPSPPVSEGTT